MAIEPALAIRLSQHGSGGSLSFGKFRLGRLLIRMQGNLVLLQFRQDRLRKMHLHSSIVITAEAGYVVTHQQGNSLPCHLVSRKESRYTVPVLTGIKNTRT